MRRPKNWTVAIMIESACKLVDVVGAFVVFGEVVVVCVVFFVLRGGAGARWYCMGNEFFLHP